MELHQETCQACGSSELNNILYRLEGERPLVLVRCGRCQELVARYELSGYYHKGQSFQSWLRQVGLAAESVVDLRETYQSVRERSEEEYAAAVGELEGQKEER